ncbi:MAG TPA: SDR family oxidoreductase [Tepidisphaeraceae bacterium]|jgi:NAD(P)-dependent dehydrogenase (short-subunit alcohol dehydrogenase family)
MGDSDSNTRYVLITGCSTGIGRACATHFANRGWQVLAGVRREADVPAGNGIRPLVLDITDSESIHYAAEQIQTIVGNDGLAGLVNNAGTGVIGPVEMVSLADWRRQFEINLFGHIAVTQEILPLLRDRVAARGMGSARIVNIGSIAGRLTQPTGGPYCASKFAMEALSDALRMELRHQGIHVSLIEPGSIQSEIWRKGQDEASKIHQDRVQPDPAAEERYGWLIRGIKASAARAAAGAIPAERVARVVQRCLMSKSPADKGARGHRRSSRPLLAFDPADAMVRRASS